VCPDSSAQGPSPDPRPAVTITQSRYRPLATPPAPGADAQRWNIPMCLRYGDRRGAAHRTCTVLGHKQQTIRLDADRCPSWVMPNADGDGYYYYDMDPAELAALARAPLSPRERTDLAHDVRALLYGGQLTIDAAMPILSALSRDRGRHTTEAVIDILDTVSVHVLAPPQRANLARQIRRQYGARARLLGLTPRAGEPEEDALLRPVLIEFVGVRGADPALAIRAARRAREWLRGAADIAPELLASTLAIAAQTGDPALFDALEAALRDQPADPDAQAARRRQLAAALGAFTTPPLARRARALLIDPSLPSAVLFPVVFAQLDHPDTRGDMIKYLKDNRDALGTIPQREFLLLSFAFGPQMCSEADLDALVALAPIDITRANSVWAKRARQYLQSSRECARMRDANLAAATAHFR
jgi:alanyl aminopeptidase